MRSLLPALAAALLLAAPAAAAEPTPFRSTAAKAAVPVAPKAGTFQPKKSQPSATAKAHKLPSGNVTITK